MNFPKSNYVLHLEAEIEWLKKQLAVAHGKMDRMEIALTSTTTPQGAVYSKLTQPIQLPPNEIPLYNKDSFAYLEREHERELTAAEEKQALREKTQ